MSKGQTHCFQGKTGWAIRVVNDRTSLDWGRDFHETKHAMYHTIDQSPGPTVLDSLLALKWAGQNPFADL
jgi:hypothetical protein